MLISPVPPHQSFPAPLSTRRPTPMARARILPIQHHESPARSVSHPQNLTLRTRTLRPRPTILRNLAASASARPRISRDPQNGHTQTPPAGLWAQRSFETSLLVSSRKRSLPSYFG